MVFSNNSTYPDSLAIEAAKYLIQRYSETNYQCNRQKLQKLVIFTHLACLADNTQGLLGQEPITATNLGLGIESISLMFGTINFNMVNAIEEITMVRTYNNDMFAPAYRYNENLLGNTVFVLDKMFETFGAYPGQLLSAITRCMSLYPKDADFLRMPRYQVLLSQQDVLNYVKSLRSTYGIKSSGEQLICNVVQQHAKQCYDNYKTDFI